MQCRRSSVQLVLMTFVTFLHYHGGVGGYPQPQAALINDRHVYMDQVAEPSDVRSIAAARPEDDAAAYIETDDNPETKTPPEPVVRSQNFIPSFFFNGPPLGHSRPFVYHQEGAYSHRPYNPRQQLTTFETPTFSGFKNSYARSADTEDSRSGNILGSGNFGVIRGGTFYNSNDDISEFGAGSHHNIYSPYYRNNGHGRPSYYINPKPTNHEQFANFRDFADINTPSSSDFSQYVVVYANKNATRADYEKMIKKQFSSEPRNIIETLALLDQQDHSTTEVVPTKKPTISATKRKLALVPPEKKPWGKKHVVKKATAMPKDILYEPLLALS